ncbi:MAG TPA: GAF domain-containing protein [Anaerolineae bacterium]|nr:GAF domain-containing protein [Anaerolineae bacterium]
MLSEFPVQQNTTQARMTDQYKRDLALFRTVVSVVNSSPELEPTLALALRTILEALGPGFKGMLLRRESQHPGLMVAAQRGIWSNDAPARIFTDNCPCDLAIQMRMPIFEPDCPSRNCHPELAGETAHSRLVTPLKTRQNTVVGVLCLVCPDGFQLETTDLSLWEDIGTQIGRAIEDARFHVQLQQVQELLHTLYAISDHLAASLDLDWVLSKVLDLSISATDAHHGSIFLIPVTETSTPRILHRDLPVGEEDTVISEVLAEGLAGWVVQHKEGTIIPDTSLDPRWHSFSEDSDPARSAIAVPLLTEGQVLGVLTLDHGEVGHFQPQHIGLMRAIAHQAAAAIQKARLHKEVTHLAEILAERVEERTRELRETQAQLIQAEKLAALGELAAGIAHEINNPLHILQLYVEHIAAQITADTPFVEFLDPMRNALDNIARLAIQLRDFSKPASGAWKPININDTMTNVLRLVNKEMMHCQIQVISQLTTDLPLVSGDTRQLEQVFLNIILNARDAMPGGGNLKIETYAGESAVHIRFADTGTGISEEDQVRIFEPYFTTKDDRGTGLGLAICQRIVSQHGGGISVSSRLGEGTIFIIHLPISRWDRSREQKEKDSA